MQIAAHVKNGVIVPDVPVFLPEGAAVTVLHEDARIIDDDTMRAAAAKRIEELIDQAKSRTTLPESLTPEEAAIKKAELLQLFREIENDPPLPLECLDREHLYGDD
jgi:hypothetical protein